MRSLSQGSADQSETRLQVEKQCVYVCVCVFPVAGDSLIICSLVKPAQSSSLFLRTSIVTQTHGPSEPIDQPDRYSLSHTPADMLDSSHCQDRFTSDEIIKYLFRLHKTNFCIFSSAFIVKSWLYRWALIVVNNSFLRGFLCWIPHTVRISLLPHDPEAPADLCVCVCESPGQCQSHCLPRCFTNPISSPSSFYLQHSLCLLSVCVCVCACAV